MNRREFIRKASIAGLGGAALPAWGQSTPFSGRKPLNVLFIMDDQHRGDCLGCEGADWMQTPNLDRLAREGIRFRRAYTSLPSCLPARASLLTGMSPWGHGVLQYAPMAAEYRYEKPRMFTGAGYRTHAVGKMHFDSHDHGYESIVLEEAWRAVTPEGFKCDYRRWFEANHPDKDVDKTGLTYTDHRGGRAYPYDEALHPTCWTAQQAVHFIDGYEGGNPWFLKVSFQRPHPPFDPPKRLMDYYLSLDLPAAQVGEWAEVRYGSFTGSMEDTPTAPRGKYPAREIRSARAAYYAAITFVDEQIGRVLRALEQRGESENTLILFTSDHGDMMGDHHLWRKAYAYEGSARVPMIVRWPESLSSMEDALRGAVSDHLVELRDVLPTFLDAAGIERPAHMEGRSMLDLARDDTKHWREILDLEHGRCYWDENAWVALTDGRHKYVYFTTTGEQQLFDTVNDPYEVRNLADEPGHARALAEWRARMVEHLAIRGEPWIVKGDLAVQKDSVKYGPNHPRAGASPT